MRKRLRSRGEGGYRGWDAWMASLTQWTWVWANSRRSQGQRSLVYGSPRGRKEIRLSQVIKIWLFLSQRETEQQKKCVYGLGVGSRGYRVCLCTYRLFSMQIAELTFQESDVFYLETFGYSFSLDKSDSDVAQPCPTLCNPLDCSLPGSSVHGIFQPRVLERVAISFSRISFWPRDRTHVSRISDRCFTVWVSREALYKAKKIYLQCRLD